MLEAAPPRPTAALALAHVPATICHRDAQQAALRRHLSQTLTAGKGCAVYMSGLPGTGKTATVQHILGTHTERRADPMLQNCRVIWINCMHVRGAQGMFQELARQAGLLKPKERKSPKASRATKKGKGKAAETQEPAPDTDPSTADYTGRPLEQRLQRLFRSAPARRPGPSHWVVVCDEVEAVLGSSHSRGAEPARAAFDALMTWSLAPISRLCLLTISNDMNLTDAFLVGHHKKVLCVHFPSYTSSDLVAIVRQRLGPAAEELMQGRVMEFLAAKVASSTGDARRMLEYCRRALEGRDPLADLPPPQTPSEKRPLPDRAEESSAKRPCIVSAAAGTPTTAAASGVPSPAGSPPALSPDTPPDRKPKAAVSMREAAALFRDPQTLRCLPEKQKHLLIAGVLVAGDSTQLPLGTWLDCYRKLCKQKRLPLASESELGDMLAGLVHLELMNYGKGSARAPLRLRPAVLRTTLDDLRYAYAGEGVAMDLLQTDSRILLNP